LLYRTRHDDDGFGIALFDRAGFKIRLDITLPLAAPPLRGELARWLDRYDAALA
jgi:hypothetical protein